MELLEKLTAFNKLFIESKKAMNLAENSIETYLRVLDRFYYYIADQIEDNPKLQFKDINRYFLNVYLNHLKDNAVGDNSRQLHITVLKTYFWFIADYDLETYGFLRDNINGVVVKTIQKDVAIYNDDEQSKIIGLINKLDTSRNFRDHRNSLILKFLLFHGIRIDELINLKWPDVEEVYDEQEGYLYKFWYIGKGNKVRDLDFPINFVEKNFEVIKHHVPSDFVVPGSTGKQSLRVSIYSGIKKLLNDQGIKEVWLHKFRHTFGKNKEVEGVNINTISDLMGHSNIMITGKYYLKNNSKAKRSAILKNLPENSVVDTKK